MVAAIVSFGKVTPEQKIEAESFGLKIYAWDEFLVVVREFYLFISLVFRILYII